MWRTTGRYLRLTDRGYSDISVLKASQRTATADPRDVGVALFVAEFMMTVNLAGQVLRILRQMVSCSLLLFMMVPSLA